MNRMLTIVFSLMLCLVLALAAGCSQPATPPATPEPTTIQTTEATPVPTPTAVPTTASITPGPTQTLSDIWGIQIQVANNGESIDPEITTTISGGKGMNVIPEIDVMVTRSDGVVEEGKMVQPFSIGKALTLKGTTQNKDRVEVWAYTPQGDKLKIYDAYVPFRSYN